MGHEKRTLGDARVVHHGERRNVPGADFDDVECGNTAQRFRVSIADGPALIVDSIVWDRRPVAGDPLGDIRVQWLDGREEEGAPRHYHRLGIYEYPPDGSNTQYRIMQLRRLAPKRRRPNQLTLTKTDRPDLATVSGVLDPDGTLRAWGAEKVGRRDHLGWPAFRKDGQLAVRYHRDRLWVPVAAMLLCQILPVHTGGARQAALCA